MKNTVRGICLWSMIVCASMGCNKKSGDRVNNGGGGDGGDTTGPVVSPKDPPTTATIGFFMDGWKEKAFTAPDFIEKGPPAAGSVVVSADVSKILTKIPPTMLGNNANIYMTQMVTEPKLLQQLRLLRPGLVRFPGGNISSIFFWNVAPGHAPADAPPQLADADGTTKPAGYWFGGNTDGWTMSTANYYAMLQQTGNEGVITINYGYARYGTSADPVAAAAHLAAEWVRYDKGRTRYWEIGNESNGTWQAGYRIDPATNHDGQPAIITGELYGRHWRVFADSMRKAAASIGHTIYIGAQLLEHDPPTWATATDKNWNEGVLKEAGATADYYIVHSYYTPYNTNSNPPEVLASAEAVSKAMMEHLKSTVQRNGVAQKPVALTEWNIFAVGSQQMVSQVAGMHAVLVVGELLRNGFGMACRWDLANAWENGNDHGLFSQGEPASGEARWNARPAFFYLYYFQQCLGNRLVETQLPANNHNINAYTTTFSSGHAGLVIVNRAAATQTVSVDLKNFRAGERYYWYELTGGEGVSYFSRKVFVNGNGPAGVAGGPEDVGSVKAWSAKTKDGLRFTLPPMSVVFIVVERQ
ncbi:alpha-L-arabinofuranosidase [Chitinophaga caseinilytica]|uniref:Alpha-L-arabinofuranosidase n=1 Tax=Chitinophaga caseinilytica TaxID=2267521 RepID=A0ABZ2YYS2_9BACT